MKENLSLMMLNISSHSVWIELKCSIVFLIAFRLASTIASHPLKISLMKHFDPTPKPRHASPATASSGAALFDPLGYAVG